MQPVIVFLGLIVAVAAYPTEDQVLVKLDDGPRYQYMSGPEGPELVDLWLKTSDVQQAARYNPDQNNHYHLFTRNNRQTSQPIPLGNAAVLRNSNYNANRKTVVLIHGWRNNPSSDFNVHLIAAYLTAEDVNVIMVDWSVGAGMDYVVALNNVIRSADHVSRYINWLLAASGGNIARYHVIGHSLGAHQAGIVGRQLGGRLPYITGLDPAMPGWLTHPQAISSNVAIYTEIMHTDAGTYGITNPAGHVDFYPNGGRGMPGCGDRNCDHHRCIFYMAESLTRGGFTGRRCDNLNAALGGNCAGASLRMGGPTAKTGNSGMFHLITNAQSPFSRG
ncbi:pancreatic triacylglycerol lipase-like [Anticarsia gemmatalis]|uniref:pancreatic triacylglycerol lipase-like n=1 Tax=Anticarsia gemmatalis TaxID=129554 RepID=UPI003F764E1D